MKWQDKLTKNELAHLRRDAGVRSLMAAKRSFAKQAEMRKESDKAGLPPGIAEPCWECRTIARKLGIYCQHGNYIGTPDGPDHICGQCENE